MKRKILPSIVAIAMISTVVVLWHFQVLQKLFAGHSGARSVAVSEEEQAEASEGEKIVRLDEASLKESGIEIATAGPGKLQVHDTLSGEIAFNSDRLAHIVPRVPGVVREVYKNLGDTVRAGTVLAVLESRDLADAKATYLAAIARLGLAQANFSREESLQQQKITAEKDYLESKQALAEAQIALRSAEQKLHALGMTEEDLKALPSHAETLYTRYEITAPIDGTVVEKHIVLGEVFKEDSSPCFVIADLTSVWVDLKVHQQDLSHIRPGLDGRGQRRRGPADGRHDCCS